MLVKEFVKKHDMNKYLATGFLSQLNASEEHEFSEEEMLKKFKEFSGLTMKELQDRVEKQRNSSVNKTEPVTDAAVNIGSDNSGNPNGDPEPGNPGNPAGDPDPGNPVIPAGDLDLSNPDPDSPDPDDAPNKLFGKIKKK